MCCRIETRQNFNNPLWNFKRSKQFLFFSPIPKDRLGQNIHNRQLAGFIYLKRTKVFLEGKLLDSDLFYLYHK